MICAQCGSEAAGRFCSNCGAPLAGPQEAAIAANPETVTRDFLEAVDRAEEAIQELDELEAATQSDLRKVRRAIEGEMRWGGLLFNRADIAKAGQHFAGNFTERLIRSGVLMQGPLAQAAGLAEQAEQVNLDTPEVRQGVSRARAFAARGMAFHDMCAALTEWVNLFQTELAYANSPGPLRVMTPPLDWGD